MKRGAGGGRRAWRGVVAMGAFGVVVGIVAVGPVGSVASVHAETTEQCVARRVADGEPRAQALTACLRESTEGTTPGGDRLDTSTDPVSDQRGESDGTSTLVVIVIGVAGVALGALGAWLLMRRAQGDGAPAPTASSAGTSRPMAPPPLRCRRRRQPIGQPPWSHRSSS